MRKFFPSFMGLATLMWIIGGTMWYNRNYCDTVEFQHSASTVAIKEGIQANNPTTPFFFPLASIQPIFVSESISVLKKTTDYLNKNKDKSLVIKGLYSSKEKFFFPQTDLGIYRADAIKTALISLGAGAENIEIISELRNDLHFVNNQLTDGIEFQVIKNLNVSFQALNLYFPHTRYKFKQSEELAEYFDRLRQFLVINPQKMVKITSFTSYTEGSNPETSGGNFSEKRLNFVKSFLENQNFKLNRFQFEHKKNIESPDNHSKIKNQRIEIRLI